MEEADVETRAMRTQTMQTTIIQAEFLEVNFVLDINCTYTIVITVVR